MRSRNSEAGLALREDPLVTPVLVIRNGDLGQGEAALPGILSPDHSRRDSVALRDIRRWRFAAAALAAAAAAAGALFSLVWTKIGLFKAQTCVCNSPTPPRQQLVEVILHQRVLG